MIDVEALRSENISLKLQLEELKQINKDLVNRIPKIQSAMSKSDVFIYQMKVALFNADDQYKQAVNLFDAVQMPEPIPGNVYSIASLLKQGKSLSEMAEIILGNKTKKSSMHRMVQRAKESHPFLFKIEEKTLFPHD